MGKIKYTTTGIRIDPYKKKMSNELEKATSLYDYSTHRRKETTGFIHNNEFVTHLMPQYVLQNYMSTYEFEKVPTIRPKRLEEPFALIDEITPTDIQTDIINAIINSYGSTNKWFMHLTHGFGKTLTTTYILAHFNVKGWIFCFRQKVLEQWKETFKNKTTIDGKRILIVDDSKILYNIYKGNFPVEDYDYYLSTLVIFKSFAKKYGWEAVDTVFRKIGIGIKVFDEAHKNLESMIFINAYTSTSMTIYLSGDFAQANSAKGYLFKKMFYDTMIVEPPKEVMKPFRYIHALVVKYNSEPTDIDQASVYTKKGFSAFLFMRYQIKQEIFFKTLLFVLDKINSVNPTGKYRTLILLNLIEQIDYITEYLKDKYGYSTTIGRYHTDVGDDEKKEALEANIIVSTFSSFDTGLDLLDIRYIISTFPCTIIEDSQASGRSRPLPNNEECYYFMLEDYGFEYVRKKESKRLNYLAQTKLNNITYIDY